MKDKSSGKKILFHELMTPPYSMGICQAMYDNILNVECMPNTDIEIEAGVEEMLNRMNGQNVYTEEDERLQKKFREIAKKHENLLGFKDFHFQCRISKKFLQDHQNLLRGI
jgi:putative glycosyltransferase (TIGR04372 family)